MVTLHYNIPLTKAIEIGIENIKKHNPQPQLKIDENGLRELFDYCTTKSNFTFHNEYFGQYHGKNQSIIIDMLMIF